MKIVLIILVSLLVVSALKKIDSECSMDKCFLKVFDCNEDK